MVERRRKEGVVVPPMSEAAIATATVLVRRVFGASSRPFFPVVPIYDMLDVLVENAHFEVVEDHLMGEDDARTYPDQGLILVRQSVYDGAACGEPRARFTLCHELGHLVMHRGVSFNRINPSAPPKIFQNSEWQADVFASHLLMPRDMLRGDETDEVVMERFGISWSAAQARLKTKKGAMKQAS